jgi:hypothetical protein
VKALLNAYLGFVLCAGTALAGAAFFPRSGSERSRRNDKSEIPGSPTTLPYPSKLPKAQLPAPEVEAKIEEFRGDRSPPSVLDLNYGQVFVDPVTGEPFINLKELPSPNPHNLKKGRNWVKDLPSQ